MAVEKTGNMVFWSELTLEWLACPRCCFAHCLFSGVRLTLTCQGQLLSLQMNPFPLLVGTFPLLLERGQGHWFFHTHPLSICLTQMPGFRCGAALVLSSGESLLLASCLNCSLSGFDQFGFLFLLWPPVRACSWLSLLKSHRKWVLMPTKSN